MFNDQLLRASVNKDFSNADKNPMKQQETLNL